METPTSNKKRPIPADNGQAESARMRHGGEHESTVWTDNRRRSGYGALGNPNANVPQNGGSAPPPPAVSQMSIPAPQANIPEYHPDVRRSQSPFVWGAIIVMLCGGVALVSRKGATPPAASPTPAPATTPAPPKHTGSTHRATPKPVHHTHATPEPQPDDTPAPRTHRVRTVPDPTPRPYVPPRPVVVHEPPKPAPTPRPATPKPQPPAPKPHVDDANKRADDFLNH